MKFRLLGSGVFFFGLVFLVNHDHSLFAASVHAQKIKPEKSLKSIGIAEKKSETVVAVVNGRKITLDMIADQLTALPIEVGVAALERKEKFLQHLVQTELLYQEALRRKLDFSPKVQSRIRLARKQILIQELVSHLRQKLKPVNEKTLRRFFDDNRKRFERKAAVRISHIVLPSREEAESALEKIQSGATFEDVAKERSIFESSRKQGGVLGFIKRGEIDRNLEIAAFTLPIGKVSEPIQTPMGWQLLRVSERRDDAEAIFEDVKLQVKKIVLDIRRHEAYESLLEKLRRENKVSLYPSRLR